MSVSDGTIVAPRRRGRPPGSKNRPKSNSGLPPVAVNHSMVDSFVKIMLGASDATESLILAIQWFSIVLHQKFDVLATSTDVPLLQRAVKSIVLPYNEQVRLAIEDLVKNSTPSTKMVIEVITDQFKPVEETEDSEETDETDETVGETEEMVETEETIPLNPSELIEAA